MLLNFDLARFTKRVEEDITRAFEWAEQQEVFQTMMDLKAQYVDANIDTWNNGAANTVARINRSLEEIAGLEQLGRAKPVQDACQIVSISTQMNQADCDTDLVNETVQNAAAPTISAYDEYILSGGSLDQVAQRLGSAPIKASSSGGTSSSSSITEESQAKKIQAEYDKIVLAAYDQHEAWVRAGKGAAANDPSLLFLSTNASPVYSTEELQMAVNQALLTYKPYVNLSNLDPTDPRERLRELHMKNGFKHVSDMIVRQIALRTAVADGEPSKLLLQTKPADLQFKTDGSVDTQNDSWIQKVALNSDTTPAESSRTDLLMMGVELQLAIERYKSQLLVESMVVEKINAKLTNAGDFR
ncbi:hypothetical protein ACYPKM_02925 [Pseudomonas aeruginosa]